MSRWSKSLNYHIVKQNGKEQLYLVNAEIRSQKGQIYGIIEIIFSSEINLTERYKVLKNKQKNHNRVAKGGPSDNC